MLSEHHTEIHTSLDGVLPTVQGLVSVCVDSLVAQPVVVHYRANSQVLECDDGVSVEDGLAEQTQSKSCGKERYRMEGRTEEKTEKDEHCPHLSLVTLLLGFGVLAVYIAGGLIGAALESGVVKCGEDELNGMSSGYAGDRVSRCVRKLAI